MSVCELMCFPPDAARAAVRKDVFGGGVWLRGSARQSSPSLLSDREEVSSGLELALTKLGRKLRGKMKTKIYLNGR